MNRKKIIKLSTIRGLFLFDKSNIVKNQLIQFFIFSTLLSFTQLLASQDSYEQSIHNTFEEYKSAILKDDVATLSKFAHPNIVKLGGGTAYYVDGLTDEINMYRSAGMNLIDIQVKQPSKILESENVLQAMLPYIKFYETKSGNVVEKHFFLLISNDLGKSWTFTDLKQFDQESIKIFVPEYNERQNIYLNSLKHK